VRRAAGYRFDTVPAAAAVEGGAGASDFVRDAMRGDAA
jgi:hypothetical protein